MTLRVQLVRAWPRRQELLDLALPAGSTVADALAVAGWAVDAGHPGLALHGRLARPETPLADGDRVELLRPLLLDPKQARRLRAQRARERAARATGA